MNCQRAAFGIPEGKIFLNGAYMSPAPHAVIEVGQKALLRKQDPTTISPEEFFSESDELRKSFAALCNISDYRQVSIIPSVSYGMATIAKNVRIEKGSQIIVVSEQFPSNVYPWQELVKDKGAELCVIQAPSEKLNRGKVWNEKIIEAITSKTAMVAIGHVHWADGTKFDLKKISEVIHSLGGILVIDGTQSVGALPFDVQDIKPDALICAGYKWLMGPYSIGLAWYGDYFTDGKPIEQNWINRYNSQNFKELVQYQDQYQPGMIRYDVGEKSNFILVPMMLRALQLIQEWKPGEIQQYCKDISTEAFEQLKLSGWWIEDTAFRAHHLVGIRPPTQQAPEQYAERLKNHQIYVSMRGDAIRVSPNIYNNHQELMRLYEVLTM